MTLILRGKSTRLYASLLVFLAAASLVASTINGGLRELLWALPIAAFIVAFGWAFFWNPRLEVGPGGIHVVNIVREHHIPWLDLELAENRWGLYLYTKAADKKISVWAVPSSAGLFNNSWRQRNKPYEDPDINWANVGTQSRIVQSGFAADLIMLRLGNIKRNSHLRTELRRQLTIYWPDETTSKVALLPMIVLVAATAGAALAFYNL